MELLCLLFQSSNGLVVHKARVVCLIGAWTWILHKVRDESSISATFGCRIKLRSLIKVTVVFDYICVVLIHRPIILVIHKVLHFAIRSRPYNT